MAALCHKCGRAYAPTFTGPVKLECDCCELQSLRQQLSAAQPAIDFCAGIHIETLTLINQANHPTLTQICEENQALRKQLAAERAKAYPSEITLHHSDKTTELCHVPVYKDAAGDEILTAEAIYFIDFKKAAYELNLLRAELAKNKATRAFIDKRGNQIVDWLKLLPVRLWFHADQVKYSEVSSELRALIPEEKK